ncbi:FG-GAP-like repeat-containing protein [Dyadobacter arcticus]|uniref:Secretion system C-terminal sorting domain-containing protein n=1 Tax=Dyadobacter arcticus TaxID=1078754 RepID=A0ABX0UQX4_9BACT|nr:FG-GAP-like repeat-containing protein [Dyadobacter arcticus]NIJ53990.1 hypothetical protein [Dyadobacter arcticus]
MNDDSGVRQNFIVNDAPANTEQLQVRLSAKGLKVNDLQSNELHFYTENEDGSIEKQLVYNGLKCWDADGRNLTAHLGYQNEQILISVDVKNATYPVTIDPIIANGNPGNANTVLESNQANAQFGYSVSSAGDVNGDGYSDVLVSAPMYDQGQADEGAVFVYHGSSTGIGSIASLILEGNQAGASLGWAVSNAGDINKDGYGDVVVGVPFYDNGQIDEGAVFAYYGSAGGLNNQPGKILEGNQTGGQMGQALALAGDVNADGYSDVIIGAYQYDKGQINEGVAAIYHGSAQGIANAATSVMESDQVNAQMGYSVRGAGDVNGDGYSDVIVSAPLYDKGQIDEGVVFVYHGSALGVNINAVSIFECNQAGALLGWSVSGAGDVNGDGYSDVIVGAPLYDNGQTNEGGVFVYNGSAAGLSPQIVLKLESNQVGGQMGHALASAGDVNGDGYADVVIGAYQYDKGQTNEGVGAIYQGSAQGLGGNASSVLDGDQTEGRMSFSIASAGDVNGDGYSDIIVGAPMFDKGENDEGAAFVWHGMASGVMSLAAHTLEVNQQNASFGFSTASAGDVNGDGFGDVVIGAFNFDNGQINSGAAFIYYGSPNGLNFIQPTKLGSNVPFAHFGSSVSGAGDINGDGYGDVIVGAPYYGNNEEDEGAVYVFYGSALGINSEVAKIIESNQKGAQLGFSIAGAGDVNGDSFSDIIAGAIWYKHNQYKEGAAFVYLGSPDGINILNTIRIESGQSYSEMGASVSGAGDINNDGFDDIVVGAMQYTNYESSQIPQGAAFVFKGSPTGIDKNTFTKLKMDQSYAFFGNDVSAAGDVNGDGYGDLIVGASKYENPEIGEGAVFVYHGSPLGVTSNPSLQIESNISNANFGSSVASIGDANGDGYSDIIIGSPGFGNNNQTEEGAAYIYYGSLSGLNLASKHILGVNQNEAAFGWSVSSAGDVNGDGLSDLIVGAPYYYNGQSDEGAAFFYYGNTGTILKNNLRLYNSNLTTIINQTQSSKPDFGAGLYAKSFLGNNRGKLVWETKPKGQGFSKGGNNAITNSTQSSGSQNAYTSLGLLGTELKNVIMKQGPSTKVCVRVKYDPTLALTGQTYGPWRYLPAYLVGTSIAPVPEEAMVETIRQKVTSKAPSDYQIKVYPNPVSDRLFVHQNDSEHIKGLQLLTTMGKSVYKSAGAANEVDVKGLPSGVYVLVITQSDGSQKSQKVVVNR